MPIKKSVLDLGSKNAAKAVFLQQLLRDKTAKPGRMHCTCHNLPPEVSEEDGHSC